MTHTTKLWIRPADSAHIEEILSLWKANSRNLNASSSNLESSFWSPSSDNAFLVAGDQTGKVKGWVALMPVIPPDGASAFEVRLEMCLDSDQENTDLDSRLLKAICAYSLSTEVRTIFSTQDLFSGKLQKVAGNLGWEPMGEFPMIGSGTPNKSLWAFQVPKVSEGVIEFGETTLFTARK